MAQPAASACPTAPAKPGGDVLGIVGEKSALNAAEELELLEELRDADWANEMDAQVASLQERLEAGSPHEEGDNGRCLPWPAETMSDWRSSKGAGRDGSWGDVEKFIGVRELRRVPDAMEILKEPWRRVWRKGQWSRNLRYLIVSAAANSIT